MVELKLPIVFFFQAEDGIRDGHVTGVQTCALPILSKPQSARRPARVATRPRSRYTQSRANRPQNTRHPQMKQHLAVSAIGSDRTGMVHELTRVISESGGNISESRMANLSTAFAMLLLVSGNWHALAKLETELKRLAETSNLSIHLKRTEPRTPRTDMLPYS